MIEFPGQVRRTPGRLPVGRTGELIGDGLHFGLLKLPMHCAALSVFVIDIAGGVEVTEQYQPIRSALTERRKNPQGSLERQLAILCLSKICTSGEVDSQQVCLGAAERESATTGKGAEQTCTIAIKTAAGAVFA